MPANMLPSRNGLAAFSIHAANSDDSPMIEALRGEVASADAAMASSDPADIARTYLFNAFANEALPALEIPPDGPTEDFGLLSVQKSGLGGNTVKFRQLFDNIPVYGSRVTVKLGEDNSLVALDTALGETPNVSTDGAMSEAEARRALERAGGTPGAEGQLNLYFDDRADPPRWRLCYLFKDVTLEDDDGEDGSFLSPIYDFMIDAHDGTVVSRRSGIAGASQLTAPDELSVMRTIRVSAGSSTTTQVLKDPIANIETYDHNFQDWQLARAALTNRICEDPPALGPGAVSAHANAADVIEFLRTILDRNGVDNAGGPLISSVNCVYSRQRGAPKEWRNAAWIRAATLGGQTHKAQMVYGQRTAGPSRLISMAVDLDVVAHEIVHGITQNSADLEYAFETGALNESYSDILAVIIANFAKPSRGAWDFRIGINFRGDGNPLRDISNPGARGHPGHMSDYVEKGLHDDNGGVHTNSAIHNKAAHAIMVATDAAGTPLFSPRDLAWLFYVALTEHLSERSLFADSRRAVESAAFTRFAELPQPDLQARLAAIRTAFDDVGIP